MEKNLNTKDKRVIKTRKAIIGATIQLMGTKRIEQITVKEIADTALINRKTFYTHYDSDVYKRQDLFRRALGDDRAALVAAFRANINDVVGAFNHIEIVLDDNDRISIIDDSL